MTTVNNYNGQVIEPLWFQEQKGSHERALTRVRDLAEGLIQGNSVVFGQISVNQASQNPKDLVVELKVNSGVLSITKAIDLKKELEAATKYILNFRMVFNQAKKIL